MNKVILEFTLGGSKHRYYRRKSIFGEAVITTNIHSAKKLTESEVPKVIELLKKQFGEKVNDIKPIKDGDN